ncbi:serine/threonine-protein kinase [Actinomadura macrotermitis]|uniref:non-specific serine/threonine protein kinase n=1 Tax=Actinomadura macrotermitis TaxID=2585200 RepID=A0A7K0BZF6_9ACTN|nr:serine/threonine-protein kinase [Actinomadura macrotermitis]MQY06034.1 Serine/threonine-protein kinase PknD [Actinomadura macrotermitis]
MTSAWRVAGFTEIRELGAGAFGRVVLARHDASGSPVAIKYLLTADADAVAALRREAELLGRVKSPYVVRLLQFVTSAGGQAAIVMEAVDGVSLKRVLDEHGTLSPEASLAVLKGSLLGLDAAHGLGVVHRDYKPANVLVRPDGLSKLADFGVATHTGQGGGSGTPVYMAPEQWDRRPASPATDVYAATCVFYRCLTGRPPFAGDAAALAHAHRTAPVPLDGIPEPLHELVRSGLAKRPEERPPTAGDFAAALESRAQAAYGADWESRGVRALAAGAVALAAAFPLAAAGIGTGTATGAAGGASAASAGGGAMAAAGGAKVVAGVAIGAVALGGGGVAAYQAARPEPKRPPAVQRIAATTTLMTLKNPSTGLFTTGAQIVTVKGLRDTALQTRVNQALRKPVDDFMAEERRQWLLLDKDRQGPQGQMNRSTPAVFKSRIGLAGPRYVSAAYDLKRPVNAGGGTLGTVVTVTVDLRTGRALQTGEMFLPAVLTPAGSQTIVRRVAVPAKLRDQGSFCDYKLFSPQLNRPVSRLASRTLLTPQGAEFLFGGLFGEACSDTAWTPVPWAKLDGLLNPEVIKAAH